MPAWSRQGGLVALEGKKLNMKQNMQMSVFSYAEQRTGLWEGEVGSP